MLETASAATVQRMVPLCMYLDVFSVFLFTEVFS